MKVYCDICKYEFEVNDLKKKSIDKIEIYYFECHACKRKYIVKCIDEYMAKELRKLRRLEKEYIRADNEMDKAIVRVKLKSQTAHLVIQNKRIKLSVLKILGEEWQ